MPAVDAFRIEGGHPLSGEVEVVGAKNSVLKFKSLAFHSQKSSLGVQKVC